MKKKPFTSQRRREYQRVYYRAHKEKALAYQRQYTLDNKRKGTPKGQVADQGIPKRCLSVHDLTKAPTDKFFRHIDDIIHGRIGFTI